MKAGYKQTEVGVIPEDWEVVSLAHITEPQRPISYGIVQTGPSISNGIRCLRVLDISEGRINKDNLITTTRQISEAYRRTILKRGDLVMPLRGKVGDVGLVDLELEGANLTRGVALIAIRSGWSAKYCQQMISSGSTRKRLESEMSGSALQEISIASLRSFKISSPSLPEQRAIGETLSDVDGLLGALDGLIAKKRDLKQASMQQLLTGQTRLPGFHGEWVIKPFDEVSSLKGRIGWQGLKQTEFTWNTGQPFLITGMNFKDGAIRWDEVYHISEDRYEIAKEIQLRIGDVLMTKDGTIGKVLFVDHIPFPGRASLNSHLLLFRPVAQSYEPKFLYYQLNSKRFKDFIELSKSGTTFFGLSQGAVAKYQVLLPPLAEQTAIAEVLTSMDEELAALEQRREKTRALKQGMMQELLTGRTRLV